MNFLKAKNTNQNLVLRPLSPLPFFSPPFFFSPSFFFFFFLLFSSLSSEEFVVSNFLDYRFHSSNISFRDGTLEVVYLSKDEISSDFFYGFDREEELSTLDISLATIEEGGFFGRSLNFLSIDNQLHIPIPDAFLPESSEYTGDFSLELYIKPTALTDGMQIIEGRSFVESIRGKSHFEGFYIGVEGGRVVAHFENFFALGDQQITFRLTSEENIDIAKWNHIEVNYQRKTGVVKLILNDQISDFHYATVDGNHHSLGLLPGFRSKNRVDLELGKKYLGSIDEISVDNTMGKILQNTDSSKISRNLKSFDARYESQVFSLKPFSKVSRIDLQGDFLSLEDISVTVCSSNAFFVAFEKREKKNCKIVPIGVDVPGSDTFSSDISDFSEGLYYQFFIDFYNKDHLKHPALQKFTLHYQVDFPPPVPQLVRIERVEDKALILWRRDFEKDIKGYNIYYANQSPEVMEQDFDKKTVFTADLIDQAKNISPNAHHHFNFVENLDPKKRYYFFITSFDKIDKQGVQRESGRSRVLLMLPNFDEVNNVDNAFRSPTSDRYSGALVPRRRQ